MLIGLPTYLPCLSTYNQREEQDGPNSFLLPYATSYTILLAVVIPPFFQDSATPQRCLSCS